MFPMTITIHSDEELALILNAVQGQKTVPEIKKPGTADPAAAKPETKKQEKAAPTAETSQSSTGTTSAPSDAVQDSPAPSGTGESTGSRTYSVDDAKALTMKIVSSRGRDVAVQLLQKYGVPVAAKLAPEQIAPFCEDAEKVLA